MLALTFRWPVTKRSRRLSDLPATYVTGSFWPNPEVRPAPVSGLPDLGANFCCRPETVGRVGATSTVAFKVIRTSVNAEIAAVSGCSPHIRKLRLFAATTSRFAASSRLSHSTTSSQLPLSPTEGANVRSSRLTDIYISAPSKPHWWNTAMGVTSGLQHLRRHKSRQTQLRESKSSSATRCMCAPIAYHSR